MRDPVPHEAGALYHAMLRGNRRQEVFRTGADRLQFEHRLFEALERFEGELHAYCWMTNHVHMLVRVSDVPLHRLIHHAAGCYARDFNRRHKLHGHLLQGRYLAKLVNSESYLRAAVRYVHRNPVVAGIAQDPGEWRWSSHRVYLGRKPRGPIITETVMDAFGNSRRTYARFLRINDEEWQPEWREVDLAEDLPRPERRRPPRAVAIPSLVRQACRLFRVRPDELQGPGRRTSLVRARAWVGYWAQRRGVASASTAAHALGRHPASLARAIRRHAHDLERWPPEDGGDGDTAYCNECVARGTRP